MSTEKPRLKVEVDTKYVSPYLLRPIRSIEQALKDRKENRSQPKKGSLPETKQK